MKALSTTFYSLYIWKPSESDDRLSEPSPDTDFNPGNTDRHTGHAIYDTLPEAIIHASTNRERTELRRRQRLLWDAVSRMEYGKRVNWWDGPSDSGFLHGGVQLLAGNETVKVANHTIGCSSDDCDGRLTVA